MANVAILWNKPSDTATLAEGSWIAGLPLANLQGQDVKRVARSTSASTSHTRFRVDLGASPAGVSSFALLGHNMTTAGRWRVVVTSDATDASPGSRVLDSGLIPVWEPTVVFGELPWGSMPWDGVDTATYPGAPAAFYLAPGVVFGRYIWVYIEDASNPAGYVQAGRFLAGAAWSSRINASYGASLRWVDPSEARRTRGGRRVVTERPRYRQFEMTFDALTEGEAMGAVFEAMRRLGIGGDFFLVMDPDKTGAIRARQSIYAAMVSLEPIATPFFDRWTWRLAAEELI